jgi:hypothetical protein
LRGEYIDTIEAHVKRVQQEHVDQKEQQHTKEFIHGSIKCLIDYSYLWKNSK